MKSALFRCPFDWKDLLPPEVLGAVRPKELAGRVWDLLALTELGWRSLGETPLLCRILLVPGNCPATLPDRLGAEAVVTYGLSPRDSLTFSSLAEPVLCVQRTLPRPDGTVVEPQELPLPPLPFPAEQLLPLLGLRLLRMPLPGTPCL